MTISIPVAEAVPLFTNADTGISYNPADPFQTNFSVFNASAYPVKKEYNVPEEEYNVPEEEYNSLKGGPKWEIHGSDMQVLHVENLSQGDELTTEIGSTMYLSPGMTTEVECALCGDAAQRVLSGENCVKVKLRKEMSDESTGYIGLTPNYPAQIIPLTLSSSSSVSNNGNSMNSIIAKPGALMSYLGPDVNITCSPDFNPIRFCCAGLGCCRQQISGGDGIGESTAFLAAGGTILSRFLKEGETITVDKRSILAYEDTVTLDVRIVGGACFCLCGGEGCVLPTLTGPGLVLLESMCFAKVKEALTPVQNETMDRGDPISDVTDIAGDIGDFFD